MTREPHNNPPSPFQTCRSSESERLPALPPEAKQETERRPGQRRRGVLEVQATHERLHVVCQEVQGGVHADAPWQGQQVGAARGRTFPNTQFTWSWPPPVGRQRYCSHSSLPEALWTVFFCSCLSIFRPDVQFEAHSQPVVGLFLCFRAISVLLGEKWKKMRSEERRVFTVQAKALADEQKRLNPDCWKRKRTSSVRRRPRHIWSASQHLWWRERWCQVPTNVENPGHTHTHSHFALVLFLHAVDSSVSSRVVREIRNADKRREAASLACRRPRARARARSDVTSGSAYSPASR